MPQVSNVAEDYSIRSPLTGDLVLSRLVLTGWGAVTSDVPALVSQTDRGRLWVKFTVSTNTLEFFKRSTMLSDDRVAYTSSAVSGGLATLVQDNSSGISGSCECTSGTQGANPTENGTTQVVVSYAHEKDLADKYAGFSTSYLDSNSKWIGQAARFEAKLLEAKRELDEHLAGMLDTRLRYDAQGRRQLADIADPRQLAPVHAYWTLALIETYRKNQVGAEFYMGLAMSQLRGTKITLDHESDGRQDAEVSMASAKLVRA